MWCSMTLREEASKPAAARGFWRRAARLTVGDAVGVARAALVLCRVAVLLRCRTFLQLLGALRLQETAPPADTARIERAEQLVRWAHRVVPIERNCLLDSLAAAALLRQQGFSAPLAIGVKLQQGVFEAHAWIGSDEQTETSVQGFRLLYRVPHVN